MKLYEYETYDTIFKKYGVPTPKYLVVQHPGQNVADFVEQYGDVVIKSQVLVGKRGKAGAVKFAKTGDEANEHVQALMGAEVYGEKPVSVILLDSFVYAFFDKVCRFFPAQMHKHHNGGQD